MQGSAGFFGPQQGQEHLGQMLRRRRRFTLFEMLAAQPVPATP